MKPEFSTIRHKDDKYMVVITDCYNSKGICHGCHFDKLNRCTISKEERESLGECYFKTIAEDKTGINIIFIKIPADS